MEFSFDRSKESEAQNTSTIANERLRKAIERNRSKQADREAQRPAPQQQASLFSQPPQLSEEDVAHIAQQEVLREAHRRANMEANAEKEAQRQEQKKAEYAQYAKQAQQAANSEKEMPIVTPPVQEAEATQSPRARLRARMAGAASMATANENQNIDSQTSSKSTGLVSRRSVARPDDTEFVPVKRTPKKVASQISYTTTSTRKKQKSMDPKYLSWLVKGSWLFCGVMVLRLIFANGGVTDFYLQKSSVAERIKELSDIKKDNMTLVREIERMRSDAGFQKKLVRDNLGFIAADEFLVLFPK